MISLVRTLTLFRKDVLWSLANIKLLAVMVLPVIFLVIFSGNPRSLLFSLIFSNVFIGLFSTSYLVIEEKNKGTLLALMTSPLTGFEVLMGKFLFNLALCLIFSALSFLFHRNIMDFLSPMILVNIAFFAGTTCFLGFLMGLFFKNEQEMSVIAPFLMFLFSLGDPLSMTSSLAHINTFFPEYHLIEILKGARGRMLLLHTLWNFLLFASVLFCAVRYTQFYFLNNRERRFHWSLAGLGVVFLMLCLTSGFYFSRKAKAAPRTQQVTLESPWLKAEIPYPDQDLVAKKVAEAPDETIYELGSKELQLHSSRIVVVARQLEEDEQTLEQRRQKIYQKYNRVVINESESQAHGVHWTQWIYTEAGQFYVLQESLCGDHIFQITVGIENRRVDWMHGMLKAYRHMMDHLKYECLHNKSQ